MMTNNAPHLTPAGLQEADSPLEPQREPATRTAANAKGAAKGRSPFAAPRNGIASARAYSKPPRISSACLSTSSTAFADGAGCVPSASSLPADSTEAV